MFAIHFTRIWSIVTIDNFSNFYICEEGKCFNKNLFAEYFIYVGFYEESGYHVYLANF